MIELPLATFLALVPALALGVVLIDLGRSIQKNRSRHRDRQAQIRHCHLCTLSYREEADVAVSVCPRCQGRNGAKSHRRWG